jgi:phosphoenolpyruvate carboxylase
MVVAVTGQESVLDNEPELQRSIRLRNPYVDPLNYVQVELLRRLRSLDEADPQREETAAAVLRTINGIASAMKNTG